jgi:hypothetical protein
VLTATDQAFYARDALTVAVSAPGVTVRTGDQIILLRANPLNGTFTPTGTFNGYDYTLATTATDLVLTVGSAATPAVSLSPQQLTGAWYDPAYSGSGFNVLMTQAGLSFYYYGWDQNGNRLWLASDLGPTEITTGTDITLTMHETNGGHFMTPAPSSTGTAWGTLTVNFSGTGKATATLVGNDGGSVALTLQMLAATTNPPLATGAWYDPAYSGSGFNILMTQAGLSFYYYGWDKSGQRLWLASDIGPAKIVPGTEITLTMRETNGGHFLSPAPSSTGTAWGTLKVNFSSCAKATATLSGTDGKVDLNLQILAGVSGLPPGC